MDGYEGFSSLMAMNCLLEGVFHKWPMCLKVFSRSGHSLQDRQQLHGQVIPRGLCGALHLCTCTHAPASPCKILDSFDPVNIHMYSISTPSLHLAESSSNLSVPDITRTFAG